MSPRTRSRVRRLACAAAVSCGAMFSEAAAAQTRDTAFVTLRVPVSLSNLHSSINVVRVTCRISGGHVFEVYGNPRDWQTVGVSGGAVNTTVSIQLLAVLRIDVSTPVGTTSNYSCHAAAEVNNYPISLRTDSADPKYKVDQAASVTGTITW